MTDTPEIRTLRDNPHAPPTAALIEIVEKNRPTADSPGAGIVIPNEIRINGTPLLVPHGEQIKIHEMTYNSMGDEVVCVTLTLFARKVVIAAEEDL